jgi:hypothetical protein
MAAFSEARVTRPVVPANAPSMTMFGMGRPMTSMAMRVPGTAFRTAPAGTWTVSGFSEFRTTMPPGLMPSKTLTVSRSVGSCTMQ